MDLVCFVLVTLIIQDAFNMFERGLLLQGSHRRTKSDVTSPTKGLKTPPPLYDHTTILPTWSFLFITPHLAICFPAFMAHNRLVQNGFRRRKLNSLHVSDNDEIRKLLVVVPQPALIRAMSA